LARELEQIRRRRQEEVRKIIKTCLDQYEDRAFALFASSEWDEGVIGIVAGRMMENLMRPVAVGAITGDRILFSARSPGEFNLIEALEECQRRLKPFLAYGGHKSAAGFSVLVKDFPEVKEALNEIALEMLRPEDTVEWIEIDAMLQAVPTPEEVLELDLLEPHGNQNPVPTFYVKDYVVDVKTGDGWSLVRTAAGFKFFTSAAPAKEGSVVHAALSLAVDEYGGTLGVIGRALDVRPLIFDREDLLERYIAWRKGKDVPKWAEVIFNELGLVRTGTNEKTSLFKSPTFLKYGAIKC
ncbi:MAG: DHHA1 domain-containing protein, partial [Thermacetogeniaceae bacterium]